MSIFSQIEGHFCYQQFQMIDLLKTNMTFISGLDHKYTQCKTNHTDVCPILHVDQCTRVQVLTEHVAIELGQSGHPQSTAVFLQQFGHSPSHQLHIIVTRLHRMSLYKYVHYLHSNEEKHSISDALQKNM